MQATNNHTTTCNTTTNSSSNTLLSLKNFSQTGRQRGRETRSTVAKRAQTLLWVSEENVVLHQVQRQQKKKTSLEEKIEKKLFDLTIAEIAPDGTF